MTASDAARRKMLVKRQIYFTSMPDKSMLIFLDNYIDMNLTYATYQTFPLFIFHYNDQIYSGKMLNNKDNRILNCDFLLGVSISFTLFRYRASMPTRTCILWVNSV